MAWSALRIYTYLHIPTALLTLGSLEDATPALTSRLRHALFPSERTSLLSCQPADYSATLRTELKGNFLLEMFSHPVLTSQAESVSFLSILLMTFWKS